jgi:hypothetical protein
MTVEKIFSSMLNAPRALRMASLCACALCFALSVPAQEPPMNSSPASAPSTDKSVATPTPPPKYEKPDAKGFASPEAAVAALCAAMRKNDESAMLVILGPEGKDLVYWTDVADDREDQREFFVHKYDQVHRLVKEPDNTVALYVGPENWPLPIPIIEYNGSWYFDAGLGKQEVLYRRVGHNEMDAMNICRALIDAEKEYHDVAHAYTNKFVSTSNAHDGLYWKPDSSNARSPIGPFLARAGVGSSADNHQAYHGYFYRILLTSAVAPDGDSKNAAKSNFVVVAFPAEYRSSGVMTFLVDENGATYEKDLGAGTKSSAVQITNFHPDQSWKKLQ